MPVIPKDETIWVSYYDEEGVLKYIITSKKLRDFYFIYEVNKYAVSKLGKSRNPKDLEVKYVNY